MRWPAAVRSLHSFGPDVRGVACDVADPVSVERAAKASYEAFGNVHVVCNNAGVAAGGGIDNISLDNWRWVLDVNLMGVLHGIRTFLPHIRGHGEGGHIVNTASMAGMDSGLGFSPYVGKQVRGGRHVGGAGDAAQAAWHRRNRALSRVRSHPHRRERAQPAGALRPGADAGPCKPGRRAGGPDRPTAAVRARPVGGRRAKSLPRSARTNSTCSRIRKCAPGSISASPRSWPRSTRRRRASGPAPRPPWCKSNQLRPGRRIALFLPAKRR